MRLNPDSYWHYLTLAGEFGGVDLLLSTTEVEADPDPAQGGGDGDGGEPVDCGAPSTDYGQLLAGKNECLSGGRSSFYVWVEEDNTRLTFSLGGGTGDADLYYAADTWAGTAHYDAFAKTAGNSETLTVTANRGWRYLAVESDNQYAGVSLSLKVATAGEPQPVSSKMPAPPRLPRVTASYSPARPSAPPVAGETSTSILPKVLRRLKLSQATAAAMSASMVALAGLQPTVINRHPPSKATQNVYCCRRQAKVGTI